MSETEILVVCQYYYPENFQVTPICEQLVKDGYAVTVLTGLPNYPTGVIPEAYRKGRREETVNGVHVIRCFEVPRGKGVLRLGINYLSYPLSAWRKLSSLQKRFDLVFVYQLSPVLMAWPGIRYAKKFGVPLVHYCCDLWPESMKVYLRNERHPVFRIMKAVSAGIYRFADRVLCQSPSFRTYLKETHGIADEKIFDLPAFAEETYLEEDFTSEDATEDATTDFVFLGNLGMAQDLMRVLSAVERIRDLPGLRVHFVGDGVCLEEMEQYVQERGLQEIVRFYGRRPVEEMPEYYRLADACLVSLKADSAIGLTLPIKVQGYMAAGRPILGMIDGSARTVIEESGCGICVPAGDVDGLAQAMREFALHPEKYAQCGENARAYFKEHFRKDVMMEKLERTFDELTGTQRK